MRRTTAITATLVAGLILAGLAGAQDRPPAADLSGVDTAIEKGVAWLLSIQEADGTWRGPQPDQYRGMTALVVYTLVKCGLPQSHPAVAAGIAAMRRAPCERTYDLGCTLMAYQALGETRPMDEVKALAEKLVRTIGNGKRTTGARWGYPGDHAGNGYGWADLSNTQYAILGLRAAKNCGHKAGTRAFWEWIAKELIDAQEAYGGFGYQTGQKASASMTVAGVTCLVVCEEFLGEDTDLGLKGRLRGAISRAFQWLDDHWAVDQMVDLRQKDGVNPRWLYYYLYGLERLGAFVPTEKIGKHWWYPEGAEHILKEQKKDGRWQSVWWEKGDDDTCFALLFLRRGSQVSGTGPRSRQAQAGAGASPFTLGMNHDNPVTVWIREAGPGLKLLLDRGARPKSLTWFLGGEEVARVEPIEKPDALYTDACHLRHTATQNGTYRVLARLELVWKDGTTAEVLESNALELRVDNVEEPWQREARRDAGRNLIDRATVTTSASSSIDDGRDPRKAVDGQFATHWICGREDLDPWIQLDLARQVPANTLKLTAANPYTEAPDRYARPRDIEVRINGEAPINVRLEDTVRRKQWVRFPAKLVHSVRVRIRSVYRGEAEANAGGFKEIELYKEDGAEPEQATLVAPGAEMILPPARYEAQLWKYTFERPPEDWYAESFRDLKWATGKSGFGGVKAAYAAERTLWATSDIWLRREFNLPKGDLGELRIEILHDDHADVYLNGVHAAFADAWSKLGYRTLPISSEARATIRSGRNLIAVHCVNTGGPGTIDVSLIRILPRKPEPAGR